LLFFVTRAVRVAYLNNSTSTVVDNTKPLIVTSCGNYRVKNRSEVVTHRPKGRKDYQLLYIASGKGHFFIHGEEKTVSDRCLLGAFYWK
jgi:AraC family transcriptional regulator of arabinose operon